MKQFEENAKKDMKMKKAKAAEEKKVQKPSVPKAAAAVVATAKATPKAVAAPNPNSQHSGGTVVPGQSSTFAGVNVPYYYEVQQDLRTIGKCLGFDFASKEPLQIAEANKQGEGGVQEPWNGDVACRALGNQGSYICAINFMWLDFTRSACPGVPLSRKRVLQLAEYMYPDSSAEPGFVKKMFEVLAPGTEEEQKKTPRGMMLLSPDEYAHAIVAACAQQLPKHKQRWETVLRSIPCVFSMVVPAEAWVAAWNNRNEITQEYESLSRSALQTATEISLLKHRADKEKCRTLKTDEFAQWLKEQGLKKASSQQDMTKNFLDTALFVAKRLQSDNVVVPIRALEEKFGTASCLNSMTVLHGICQKPNPSHLAFVLQSLENWVAKGKLENGELTRQVLLGGNHVCGLVSLFEYKHELLQHWLSVVVPRAKLLERDRPYLIAALENHEACEQRLWSADVAWQGNLERSSLEALQFMEACFFLQTIFSVVLF